MKQWIEKLKSEKKEQILILLLAGVLLLVIAIPTGEKKEESSTAETKPAVSQPETYRTKAEELEQRLEQILSQVEGIGRTKVMITLRSSGKKVVEKDLERAEGKEESSQEGTAGSQSQISENEDTVYERDAQGNESPYVAEELEPEIEGVLVIAQGAGNSAAAAQITEAVMALFGVEAHKIKVMKME